MPDFRPNDYWNATMEQRMAFRASNRQAMLFNQLYRSSYEKGNFFDTWGANIQKDVFDPVQGAVRNLRRLQGPSIDSLRTGTDLTSTLWRTGVAALAFTGPLGIAAFTAATIFGASKYTGPTDEEYESIAIRGRLGRPNFVNTAAAQTMRQATLSAMHNSVYSLRGALGNEASLLHE